MAVTWEKLLYQSQLDAWAGSVNLVTVGDLVLGGTNKRITFATNDYLEYNASENKWYFKIDNVAKVKISSDGNIWCAGNHTINGAYEIVDSATGFQKVSNDMRLKAAAYIDINAASGLKFTGTNRRITFDTGDYLKYNTVLNRHEFLVGYIKKAVIGLTYCAIGDTVTRDVRLPMLGAKVTRNTDNQTILTSTLTAMVWDTEEFDTDSMVNLVANNTRITIQKAGYYRIGFQIPWAEAAGGRRLVLIKKNDTYYVLKNESGAVATADVYPVLNASTVLHLAANDYLECIVFQSSGGNLDVLRTELTSNFMHAVRVASV